MTTESKKLRSTTRILLAAMILVAPLPLFACGSAAMMLGGYWDPAASPDQKTTFLMTAGCGNHVNYFPREDDLVIAKVLVDAIQNELPRDAIAGVLKRFHCVYAARREPYYEVIRAFIGDEAYISFCDVSYLQRLVIVQTPSGAMLRNAPSASAERVNAVRHGAYMEVIATHGDWFEVDAKLYGQGFVHKQLVGRY